MVPLGGKPDSTASTGHATRTQARREGKQAEQYEPRRGTGEGRNNKKEQQYLHDCHSEASPVFSCQVAHPRCHSQSSQLTANHSALISRLPLVQHFRFSTSKSRVNKALTAIWPWRSAKQRKNTRLRKKKT